MEKRALTWTYPLALVLFFVGIRVGIGFADIDQSITRHFPFANRGYLFAHRSILTHGWLLPLLLFCLVEKTPHHAPRLFAIGFFLASSVHLCFDLFPRCWSGYALIKIPFYGYTSGVFSWLWIGASGVICLHLALLLMKWVFELLLSCIGMATTFGLSSADEYRTAFPLFALLVFTALALALPSRAGSIVRQMKFSSGQHD